ncbi:HD-GYP domain-containing protein [Roseomonas rosulenta]|uniref:HD-GYP domain-containing protein n=1 Tax=Roseomonas rosulenta TaxID=2748667 RepID=UPI0018DF580B|nr:HD domain-containing phosphohydrolase [Roseomonas rosulenta]
MDAVSLIAPDRSAACTRCGRTDASAGPCACAAHDEALEALALRAVAIDPEGRDHPVRVGRIAALLAEQIGVEASQRAMLQRAAVLHDIGKMALPEGVLGHSHVLDPAARRVMERHTSLGASILAHVCAPWMRLAATIALNHHERWDGSGYPAGLAREDIPLAARLVAVADVYDALRSDRPYKGPLDHDEAMSRLLEGDGRIAPAQFDPQVLDALRARAAEIGAIPH